jgi:hypothetical protein
MPGSSIVLCAIGKSASTTTKTGLRAGFENTSLEGKGKKVSIGVREGIMRVPRGAPSLLLVSCHGVTATAQQRRLHRPVYPSRILKDNANLDRPTSD